MGGKSLLGRRSILAHCGALPGRGTGPDGRDRNLDLALPDLAAIPRLRARCHGSAPSTAGVNISVGTDFGGGDEWLIPQVLGDAFKVHISEPGDAGVSLHPAELLFIGTLGGARALDMEDRIGNFDAGKEADFVVVDPAGVAAARGGRSRAGPGRRTPTLARDQTLFALLMSMREPAITRCLRAGPPDRRPLIEDQT